MSTLAEAHAKAALISQGARASYLFEINGSECRLLVVSFSVEEQVSCPFEMDVTVATQDEVVLEDLLDKDGVLTIEYGDSRRHFHGIVKECACLGDHGDYSIFQIQLVPSIWLLSLEQECRIFQDTDTVDIICQVFKESGIDRKKLRIALKDTERKRAYCVQYRETDLNFISRLLEEEGIFYFFEHYENKHVIVLADNPSACPRLKGEPEIRFNVGGGTVPAEESVSSFLYSHRLHPGKVVQRDYNYMRRDLDLSIDKRITKHSRREVYDYPGLYFKQKKGELSTQIHKERIQSMGETAEGISNCPRLAPCSVWTLTNYDFAGEYVTLGVSHSGSQPQVLGEQAGSGGFSYHNTFVVIPAEVAIRPQLVADKPVIYGIQTATVVGPEGEEIHTDKHGRIMVQFHWARPGKYQGQTSCMIRVAQTWGGLGRGAQYIPRVGDEVLVEFADGNPDRPIVTGSVYNGDNLPVNNLEKSITQSGFRTKTHRGTGFNELRFDDQKGDEEVYIHCEKDFNITVKSSESKSVGNMLVMQIGKAATISAGEQIKLVCGNASIVLDQSGKIVIEGSEVLVTGNGAVQIEGSPIRLNA